MTECGTTASSVHGITNEFVEDKLSFRDVSKEFVDFIRGAVVVTHNAPFDMLFLDQEFLLLPARFQPVGETFEFLDTLEMARDLFPLGKNNLDALCRRFNVGGRDGSHGALMDAEILSNCKPCEDQQKEIIFYLFPEH